MVARDAAIECKAKQTSGFVTSSEITLKAVTESASIM